MKQMPYCGRANSGRHRPKPRHRGYLVRGICTPTLSRDILLSTLLAYTLIHSFPWFEGPCFGRYEVWVSVGCQAILNERHFVFYRVSSLVWTPLNVIRDVFQMERLLCFINLAVTWTVRATNWCIVSKITLRAELCPLVLTLSLRRQSLLHRVFSFCSSKHENRLK